MANFFCANCSWQGNAFTCPNCGESTENLYVEDHSGMPTIHELEFATADVEDVDAESLEDDF